MLSLLLIISFLIHIIALYAIYRLSQQVQSFKKADNTEIAELFESYLQEIREENKRLQDELNAKTSPLHVSRLSASTSLERKNDEEEKDTTPDLTENDLPISVPDVDDLVETSLEARILQLHHQGLSITEIAQQLNRGKTEVELFIKLHEKK